MQCAEPVDNAAPKPAPATRVLIGVLTYNRREYVELQAASLAAVRDVPWGVHVDVWVYDDGSDAYGEAELRAWYPMATRIVTNTAQGQGQGHLGGCVLMGAWPGHGRGGIGVGVGPPEGSTARSRGRGAHCIVVTSCRHGNTGSGR
jgi:hypothetical protein